MSVHDFTVRYDGEGYKFEVFVNSNEPPAEIARRLTKAARGQIKAACLVACTKLSPEEVTTFMAALAKTAATGIGVEVDLNET